MGALLCYLVLNYCDTNDYRIVDAACTVVFQFIVNCISNKIKITQPIVVEISSCYASTIVCILVGQDIDLLILLNQILKMDIGMAGRELGE